MQKLLIIGSSSSVGQILAENLLNSHELWTLSRRAANDHNTNHTPWNATLEEFPSSWLPERLDGLIYCPGSTRLQPFNYLTDDVFQEDFELNLLGAARAIRAALPALDASLTASILLFPNLAVTSGVPTQASISAAKDAVKDLTESLAAELAPKIRVNAITSSMNNIPLAVGLLNADKQSTPATEQYHPTQAGHAEKIAATARFLLSDKARWVTGQVLHVDSGDSAIRYFN